jgi:mono/diheme cytochrome c family protein
MLLAAPAAIAAPAPPPRDALPLDAPVLPLSYRLHVEFAAPGEGSVRLAKDLTIELPKAASHDIAVEHPAAGLPVLRVWTGDKLVRGPEEVAALAATGAEDFPDSTINFAEDFTAVVSFSATGNGTLFAKCAAKGEWVPDAKALFIQGGRLAYDVGWRGTLSGGRKVNDGKPHTAVVVQSAGTVKLWLDGELIATGKDFARPDVAGHILRIGRAADDYAGDLTKGSISNARIWTRALSEAEVALLFKAAGAGANTPDFTYTASGADSRPVITTKPGTTLATAWIQPLERSDHAQIIQGLNAESLEEGRKIYTSLCVVCHGTKDQPGSLPTAPSFASGAFKNGADPFSMYTTLTNGFGQMVAQPQYTTAQKYAVIQYIRESFLRPHNPKQLTAITPEYLANLPKGLTRVEAEVEDRSAPQHERMNLGPALFWTFQIEPDNIAQKGIAVRLDPGTGGVSKGRAWMVYDHDLMRVAAATSGGFVDWKGIAFDGSHNSHTSLTGTKHFVNPVGPGWASPTGSWDDPRPKAKDGRPYGPLPREWAQYLGLVISGERAVISAKVGGTPVLETPGWLDYGPTPVFTRTLNVATAAKPLLLRVAPEALNVVLAGNGTLRKEGGFWVAELPSGAKTRLFISETDPASLAALAKASVEPLDLTPLTKGGARQWTEEIITTSEVGAAAGAFASDNFPLPEKNPWDAWMRPGGFDFTPDGKGAIVAMWNGDVWRVEGILAAAPAKLTWRRIATGLFQPLGVKFRGNDLFVTCRDQLARLRDLNADGEIDFIECFNNDHQVTEHFHEFAMGLQTDAAGNFYYAKSARHALDSLVPHHGTLLRVSADGSKTDIVANGFRAANGVCLNPDGSFFVTDQEGHWTPKNRINHVKPGGFYGNMFGYSNVTDNSDAAMEPPMVWITNDKDRSPAELLWVPKGAWGPLGGSLLNLSYGTGRIFIVPNEEVGGKWQGAVCELPMPAFKTGIMRGRFHPDGALYASGMFAWAGNASDPGGFHRIRHTAAPACLPLAIHATRTGLTLTFSDPLDPASVTPAAFNFKVWSAKRTANYGSKHIDEHPLAVSAAKPSADGKSVVLTITNMAPTMFYQLGANLRAADGSPVTHSIHGTIHALAAP